MHFLTFGKRLIVHAEIWPKAIQWLAPGLPNRTGQRVGSPC
jgi:hypothetical protein